MECELNQAAGREAPSTTMWLPAQALNCYEGDARLRSWLTEPGLLTQRMRAIGGPAFRLNVIREETNASGHLREIELLCAGQPWLYAETRVPATTLAAHRWLCELGGSALGEVLAARADVDREPLAFALESPESPLVSRALARARLAPQSLWVRRSSFTVGGSPFVLHEIFHPRIGVMA